MNYLNDKKETIFFSINADDVNVSRYNFYNDMRCSIVLSVDEMEKLVNDYRALFQDNHHNVSECEDLHCSDTQCYEYRQEQKYKYIHEK